VARFVDALREDGVHVETGPFGAMIEVELVNDGPVTIVLDSERAGGVAPERCYPSFTTFHLLGEMGAVRAHSF